VKFPDDIEQLLTEFMLNHLKVKATPVTLGRKEIEERLIDDRKPKYNIKTRRGEVLAGGADIPPCGTVKKPGQAMDRTR